jgi:hypothetical protein
LCQTHAPRLQIAGVHLSACTAQFCKVALRRRVRLSGRYFSVQYLRSGRIRSHAPVFCSHLPCRHAERRRERACHGEWPPRPGPGDSTLLYTPSGRGFCVVWSSCGICAPAPSTPNHCNIYAGRLAPNWVDVRGEQLSPPPAAPFTFIMTYPLPHASRDRPHAGQQGWAARPFERRQGILTTGCLGRNVRSLFGCVSRQPGHVQPRHVQVFLTTTAPLGTPSHERGERRHVWMVWR